MNVCTRNDETLSTSPLQKRLRFILFSILFSLSSLRDSVRLHFKIRHTVQFTPRILASDRHHAELSPGALSVLDEACVEAAAWLAPITLPSRVERERSVSSVPPDTRRREVVAIVQHRLAALREDRRSGGAASRQALSLAAPAAPSASAGR